MTYNLTIVGNGFVPLMKTANNIVDGYLGVGFLILYIAVAFVVMKAYPSKKAAMSASFLGMILTSLFRYMEIVTDTTLFISFSLFILSTIWIYLQKD